MCVLKILKSLTIRQRNALLKELLVNNNWKLFHHFIIKYTFNFAFPVAVSKILVIIDIMSKGGLIDHEKV